MLLVTLLRWWVGLVAVMALVNAAQCFLDQQYPRHRIYDLQPTEGRSCSIMIDTQ